MGVHDGHRERVRQTFVESGLDSFNDIKSLELLLFFSRVNGDTNPLAHKLLERFKTLSGVLSASYEDLLEVDGVGENTAVLIKLVPELVKKAAVLDKRKKKQITSPSAAAEFLIPFFMFEENEKILILCLDSSKKVINCEELSRGVVNTVDINSRLVAETALRYKASSVILAHNHPDGNTSPSTEDVSTTKAILKSLALIGIQLVDHIIVSNDDYSSLCELGYI